MTLQKQDCGVWVKASDELPPYDCYLREVDNKKTPIGKVILIDENNIHFDYGGIYSVNYYEWLKPLKDVYVLTENEIINHSSAFLEWQLNKLITGKLDLIKEKEYGESVWFYNTGKLPLLRISTKELYKQFLKSITKQ